VISSPESGALKVGDAYRCPDNHWARIVWISENGKLIGVKCAQKHFSKMTRVADLTKSRVSPGRYPSRDKKVFVRNLVFLMSVVPTEKTL